YKDLDVYQRSYKSAILVVTRIIPSLPSSERFDLRDQISRSSKAVPRLIAEGFAKKHQRSGFQKYLDDAMAETNETQVSLCQVRDIYPRLIDVKLCDDLIKEYDIIGRQLFRLKEAWNKFSKTKTN
ncbi:MAG: four helix bundle protein, partial [bacterium]|nr:four helix bundle protein [bacterium]